MILGWFTGVVSGRRSPSMIDRSGLSPSLVASSTRSWRRLKGQSMGLLLLQCDGGSEQVHLPVSALPQNVHRTDYIDPHWAQTFHGIQHHLRLPCARGLKPDARFAASLMKEGNEMSGVAKDVTHVMKLLSWIYHRRQAVHDHWQPALSWASDRRLRVSCFAALALFRRPWTTTSSRSSLQLEFISVSVDESFPLAGVPGLWQRHCNSSSART